jgi:hypothetical protein
VPYGVLVRIQSWAQKLNPVVITLDFFFNFPNQTCLYEVEIKKKIQTCIAGGFHVCVLRKHLLIIKPRSLRRGLIIQSWAQKLNPVVITLDFFFNFPNQTCLYEVEIKKKY